MFFQQFVWLNDSRQGATRLFQALGSVETEELVETLKPTKPS